MKKVLAALLAVLLLTCVFATVAMAERWNPAKSVYADMADDEEFSKATVLGKEVLTSSMYFTSEKPYSDNGDQFVQECKKELEKYILQPPTWKVHVTYRTEIYCTKDHKHFWEHDWIDKDRNFATCFAERKVEVNRYAKMTSDDFTCDDGHWVVGKPVKNANGEVTQVPIWWDCAVNKNHNIHGYVNFPAHTPGEWVITEKPTCTEKGKKVLKCTTCKEVLSTEEIGALGHEWDEVAEAKYLKTAANCKAPAVYYKSCSRCGESSEGHKDEATFEYGEKDFAKHVGEPVTKDLCTIYEGSTCEGHQVFCDACNNPIGEMEAHTYPETGWADNGEGLEENTCSKCGHIGKRSIEHQHEHVLELVPEKKATCVKGGHNAYYTCTEDCPNGPYLDAEGNQMAEDDIFTDVDPNNHVGPYEYVDNGDGKTHTYKCKAEGCAKPVIKTEDHHMHKHGDTVLTSDGYSCTTYVCAECRYTYTVRVKVDQPTEKPTEAPTTAPTEEPTAEPTAEPTEEPTTAPTEEPTAEPTAEPTTEPTAEPSTEPSAEPSVEPSAEPTKKPGGTKIPKTGDNSHFGYAYLMIAVAAAGLCVLAATRRKEGSK